MTKYKIEEVKLKSGKVIEAIEGLVLLEDLDPSFLVDLKYATKDNFFETAVYPVPVCAIKLETGKRLIKAHEIVKEEGYKIKVWDAYRPLNVQRTLYDMFPNSPFVAKPPTHQKKNELRPRHNNGMAVDITLVDGKGRELEMPSGFDDFTEKANPTREDMTKEAKKNINYLMEVMLGLGFRIHSQEWWHFVDGVEEPSPYLDIPLEAFL